MSFELIIFDCDGTLVASEAANNLALAKAFSDLGFAQYDHKTCLEKFPGKSIPNILKQVEDETGVKLDYNIALKLIEAHSLAIEENIVATPGVNTLLHSLTQQKCVASNGMRNMVISSLKKTELLDHFGEEKVFTRDMVSNPKPAPDLFLHAADILEISPQRSLVIEDSVTGVEAARHAGMDVIGFVGTSHNPEYDKKRLLDYGAKIVISNIEDLLNEL